MDRLSGGINALYQIECRGLVDKPWALRNSYINVILDKTDTSHLLQQFSSTAIPTAKAVRLSRLLEAQRYCQAMYTSCGWYFEDLSRIETRNNIGYASMAIEQARLATGVDLSSDFRSDLAAARSWISDEAGKDIYDRIVAQRKI